MKRLTERDEYGNADICGVASADLQCNLSFAQFNLVTDALNRLAAYEDSNLKPETVQVVVRALGKALSELVEFDGMTMERLKEVLDAEKDGRLVVLPCKVWDTVYLTRWWNGTAFTEQNPPDQRKIQEFLVLKECVFANLGDGYINVKDFGEGCFLAREEAEAALETEKGENHEAELV